MSARIRILIYSRPFAPMTGGQETVVWDLALGLAGAKQADGTAAASVTVATQAPRREFDDGSLPFRMVRRPSPRELLRLIRTADVVHLAGPAFFPIVAALALRKPLAVEHHGFQTICPNGQLLYEPDRTPCPGHFRAGRHHKCLGCNTNVGSLNSLKMWLLTFPRRWLCTRVSSNIMPTSWLGGLLQLPRSTTVFHSLPDRAEPSPSQSVHSTFAFVGRLVGTKGLPVLLQAAHELRAENQQFKIKVIGDGSDREALQRRAADLGVAACVQFLGYLSPADLEEHLKEPATVVMPSLAGEVFGMVAAENMLRGKLVIVTDIGAMREVIGDAGMAFAPGDSKALAVCMRRVLDEPDLAAALGAKARQRAVRVFQEERMVAEHLEVYRQILGEPAPAPQLNPKGAT
jgi:glycogen(starch) synthase